MTQSVGGDDGQGSDSNGSRLVDPDTGERVSIGDMEPVLPAPRR